MDWKGFGGFGAKKSGGGGGKTDIQWGWILVLLVVLVMLFIIFKDRIRKLSSSYEINDPMNPGETVSWSPSPITDLIARAAFENWMWSPQGDWGSKEDAVNEQLRIISSILTDSQVRATFADWNNRIRSSWNTSKSLTEGAAYADSLLTFGAIDQSLLNSTRSRGQALGVSPV